MHDELDIEDCTEPKDGDGIHDDGPVDTPIEVDGRLQRDNGFVLDNGKGQSTANGQEHDDEGQDAGGVLCRRGPKRHHGPSLVHQRSLDNHGEEEREGVGGDAGAKVAGRDTAKVARPVLVKVTERRAKVREREGHADDVDEQAHEVQHGRGAGELPRGREDEHDEEHGDAGPHLGAVVHDYADCFVAEGVDHGDGDLDDGGGVGGGDGDVLRVWVKRLVRHFDPGDKDIER